MSDQQPDNPRYQQAKTILHKALDLTPGARDAYLDAACGSDAELRAEVRSLLDAHEAAGSRFLRDPARPETGPDHAEEDVDLTGQRVGAYRLERLIRRGGMGAVYLAARDDGEYSKHVAIKFIRPSLLSPSLLKRFKVERQILADFDHPGIARLIDGGTTEQGIPFFIMEFVQGEALDDVLLQGPLPQARASRLAVSVAEVLEAIHSKGLVYRDLKPSNIMLTGTSVKVLDFGIAKIMQDETGGERTLTEPGWIVGSPPYMSPEQASGGRIDARSDVFSYGVVIFEALTGHLPFSGDAREEYVRNLISAEPKALPASVPARLRAVVDRCLKKAPSERFSSGGELAYAVRAALAPDIAERRPVGWQWWMVAAGLALIAGGLGVWAWLQGNGAAPPALAGPPKLVATWASSETNPRISPDLRWISFISNRDGVSKLWLLDRVSGAERSIVPPAGELTKHVWSPSSDRIAYVYGTPVGVEGKLVITPIDGGTPTITGLPHANVALVRWIRDGIYYLDLVGGSLWCFDLNSRRSREVTTQRGSLSFREVDVSADERRIVFTAIKDTVSSIFVAAIDGSGAVRQTEDRIVPRFLRWRSREAREVVYVSDQSGVVDVWLLDVVTRRRQPLTITDAREGDIDVSSDGMTLVYEQTREDAHLATLDPFAKNPGVKRQTSESLSDFQPSPSASGTVVAFQRSIAMDSALGLEHATIRVSRDEFSTLPDVIGEGFAPEISPDGRWVTYLVRVPKEPGAQLWLRDLQARDRPSVLVPQSAVRPTYLPFPLSYSSAGRAWSAQGPRLFFLGRLPGGYAEIFSLNPSADGVPTPEQITRVGAGSTLTDLRVSADGNRLSYLLRSDSREVVELREVDLTRQYEERVLFSEKASFRISGLGWTADGAVVVLRSDPGMTQTDVILVRPQKAEEVGRLREITQHSAVLDPQRHILYFTREQKAVWSLHAFSFAPGGPRRERLVYEGEPHGPAFSGLRVIANGQLRFSYQAQRDDILSNDFRK